MSADTTIRPRVPWLNWPAWRRHGGAGPPPPTDQSITTEDQPPIDLTTEDTITLVVESSP